MSTQTQAVLVGHGPTPAAETFTLEDQPPPPVERQPWEALLVRSDRPYVQPPKIPREVLAIMLEDNPAIPDELVAAIDKANIALEDLRKQVTVHGDARTPIAWAKDWTTARNEWCDRLGLARAILGIDAPPPPPSPWPESYDFAGSGLVSVRPEISKALTAARTELATVEGRIADRRAILRDPDQRARCTRPAVGSQSERGPQDCLGDELTADWYRQQELTAKIERLERIDAQTTGAVAERFASAVKRAGGEKRLVKAIGQSWLDGTPPADLVEFHTAFHAAKASHTAAREERDKFVDGGSDDKAELKRHETQVTAALDEEIAARAKRVAEYERHAAALVESASAGDEPAILKLEALCRTATCKIPAHVRPALMAARLG